MLLLADVDEYSFANADRALPEPMLTKIYDAIWFPLGYS